MELRLVENIHEEIAHHFQEYLSIVPHFLVSGFRSSRTLTRQGETGKKKRKEKGLRIVGLSPKNVDSLR